ncbi:MAG: hypothetical protein P4M04_00365 [Acidobacteriota bacterium]|nr:hypothetical protein [Acidobacteriota bacterium]
MPTVMDPKLNEEPKPQSDSRAEEPELFAAEVAMEGKSSGFVPIIFIFGLVLVVGGAIFYFIKGARDVLSVPAATTAITKILDAQGPATVQFSTGDVGASLNEKIHDPHYKLLAKAGVIITKPKGDKTLIVNLTDSGERLLSSINGVEKTKNPDGTTSYRVPLAERKVVEVTEVKMLKPHLAQVSYTWKWVPNRLGQEFDASGSSVKSFTTWDRSTLIKSYGVDFYRQAPTKANIVLMEKKDGVWTPYTD